MRNDPLKRLEDSRLPREPEPRTSRAARAGVREYEKLGQEEKELVLEEEEVTALLRELRFLDFGLREEILEQYRRKLGGLHSRMLELKAALREDGIFLG